MTIFLGSASTMRVLGLCVGVNQQQDQDLRVLPFAGDDAEALGALLADWGDEHGAGSYDPTDVVVLTGGMATRTNVLAALNATATRSAAATYDLAVVHFAAHGDPSGYLLAADSAANDPTTGVSLGDIAAATGQIQARHTVVAFDACFSGRAGLLTTRSQDTGGSAAEVAAQLQALANERRAVIWACGADERALESARLGHGLLSYGLLHGLEHPDRLERGDEISLMLWIEQAMRVAAQQAAADRRTQTPGCRVLWQGVTTVPRPNHGSRRSRQLAARQIFPVSSDVRSLDVYGFGSEVIDALVRRLDGAPLTNMQRRSISPDGLLAGRNLVVAAPTSTGKTLIGELAALGAWQRGRRAVFLMPSRALVQEKYEEFAASFGSAGVVAVRSYGGVDDDDAALAALQFDVAFMTYEKCLAYCLLRPELLDALGAVVLDEAHLLGDATRGSAVELLLALVRQRARAGQKVQIVALSAALGDLGGLPEWLGADVVTPDPRPVPLRIGVVDPTGTYRFRVEEQGGYTEGTAKLFDATDVPLLSARKDRDRRVRELVTAAVVRSCLADEDKRMLVFRAHKPETRSLARQLAHELNLPRVDAPFAELALAGSAHDQSRASVQLRECLERGVAFHLADLEQRERAIIERAVRAGDIRLTVATSTIAMGVNTPATDVVLVDCERYDSDAGGMVPYSVGDVRNTTGRAGRWVGGAREGRAYLVAASSAEADRLYRNYIDGNPAPLRSQLGRLALPDLVLALLGAGRASSLEGVIDAALDTFDGHQHGEDAEWRQALRRGLRGAVASLITDGFVQQPGVGGVEELTLTAAGAVCARESFRVASATQLLEAAERIAAAGEPLDEIALLLLAQTTQELDEYPSGASSRDRGQWGNPLATLLPRRPVARKELVHANRDVQTRRHKRACALVWWTQGLPVSAIEDAFGRHYADDTQTFAGVIRGIAERTTYVLRAIAAILATRFPNRASAFDEMVAGLKPRLELGIAAGGADLGRARLGLTRGEIRALSASGCTSPEALAAALADAPDRMAELFGSSRASEVRVRLEGGGLDRVRRRRAREDAIQRDLFAMLVPIDTL